jgi:hypothetical protein
MKAISYDCFFEGILFPVREEVMTTNQLGRYNEERVLSAVEALKPWWYVEFCWADDEEDKRGIDLWIKHRVMGWVAFQVKSSKNGFRSHVRQSNRHCRKGGSKIPCVISNSEKTLSDIVSQLDTGFRFERLYGFFKKRLKSLSKLRR